MKNRVDIGKLIDEKYSDGKLSIREFNQLIDSVLSEKLDGYWGKIDTAELEEVSQGQDVFDHAFGMGGAENPIPKEPGYGGTESPQVRADKIAEAESNVNKEAKTYTVKVPDLFSMITNSQMEPNDEDRKLIKRIVLNLKDVETKKGNWIERVKSINKFTEDAQGNPSEYQDRDIRRAVSNLIFLNLLKKISFFVAQPGKLFEYIIAPLIGTEAKVVGSVDQDIVDVTKESQGKVWDYSVKLFTGKKSGFELKGSRDRLKKAIDIKNSPITYIIAVSNVQTRSIEFAELRVSDRKEHFSASPAKEQPKEIQEIDGTAKPSEQEFAAVNEWGVITTVGDGIILKNEQENAVGVYIPKIGEKDIAFKTYGAKQPRKIDRSKNIEFAGNRDTYENFVKLSQSLEPISMQLNSANYLDFLKSNLDAASNSRVMQFRTSLSNAINFINKYSDEKISTDINSFYWTPTGTDSSQIIAQRKQVESKVNQVKNLFNKLRLALKNTLNAEAEKMKSDSGQQAEIKENINFQVNEQPVVQQNKESAGSFSVRLQGSWANLVSLSLNLGDPKLYNEQQLKIVSNLAGDMEKVLNAYQDLNTNLVNFFATSKQAQQSITKSDTGYGDEVLKNAEDIKSGVNGLLEKEGTPSKIETK